jgi:hypothetical protein
MVELFGGSPVKFVCFRAQLHQGSYIIMGKDLVALKRNLACSKREGGEGGNKGYWDICKRLTFTIPPPPGHTGCVCQEGCKMLLAWVTLIELY